MRVVYWLAVACVLLGGCLYLYMSSSSSATLPDLVESPNALLFAQAPQNTSLHDEFAQAVLKHANHDRVIFLASVDSSYLPMALNLYETSFKKLGIKHYLFGCSDGAAHKALESYGINSVDFLHDKDSQQPSSYGTKAFRRKTHMKTKMILDALLLGLTVIIIDVDIVLFKDPVPFMNCADCDIQIQSDMVEGNSGFYMARPTKASIKLHETAWDIALRKGESISNQKALDRNMESMTRKHQIKVKSLAKDVFPPGCVYFESGKRMFYTDNPPSSQVLVHNNWIVSKAAKIYRFKEVLLWIVDTGKYYTDSHRKYLFFDNPLKLDSINVETENLKTALAIGHFLNRTVILPTFSCSKCKYGACKVPSKKCTFNTHYKIASFDAEYENQYREHVFLHHPMVPDSVKVQSQIYLIRSTNGKPNITSVPDNVKILDPADPKKGPTKEEILNWFRQSNEPVLRFHSLYNIYGNLKDTAVVKDKAFNTKTDYRQY